VSSVEIGEPEKKIKIIPVEEPVPTPLPIDVPEPAEPEGVPMTVPSGAGRAAGHYVRR
jgi:hypothetical protein